KLMSFGSLFFFFQAEDGIRAFHVTGVQTCALPIYTDTFDEKDSSVIAHIDLADWADLIIVAPGTANVIGKLAGGIGDDMVTTTLLAATDRKSTRLNSSHVKISYAVFCLKKKTKIS